MSKRGLAAVIGCSVVCLSVWIALHLSGFSVADENGPMENFQAACLGAGALLWFVAVTRAGEPAGRLLYAALAMFFVSFLVREIEVEGESAPRVLEFLLNGTPRNIWVGTAWLVLFVLFLRRAREVWGKFLMWVKGPSGRLMIAGGVVYALTWPLDKAMFGLPKATGMFLEELADVLATMLMLMAAVATLLAMRHARAGGGETNLARPDLGPAEK